MKLDIEKGIRTEVIWIDPNIDNEQNRKYSEKLKSTREINLNLFNNVDDAINCMKTIKFKETKIIVSGKLYSELVINFKENIRNMNIYPKIVVFTSSINKFIENNEDY